jgi:hypothetical protein
LPVFGVGEEEDFGFGEWGSHCLGGDM